MLDVTFYDAEGIETAAFDAVDYVSLISPATYGPPALVAPSSSGARAKLEEEVLYINTRLVPIFKIVRVSD